MPVRSPAGVNLRYRFTSISASMAATLPPYKQWTVVGSSGVVIAGGVTGATTGPIYPARSGKPISTADIEESAVGGFVIESGTLTATIAESGGASAGYLDTEVVTVAGGVIDVGAQQIGTRATFVVTVVAGEVTAITPIAGTAGFGDYYFLPTEMDENEVTGGSGSGLKLALTQAVTGVSRNGSNELVLEPHRSAGTPSSIVLALPILHGSDGWWRPETVGLVVEFGTQTQLAGHADVEKSSYIGVRIERLGSLKAATEFSHIGLNYEGASSWATFVQRGSDLQQNLDTMTPANIVSGDVRQVEILLRQNAASTVGFVVHAQAQLFDDANKITPAAANQVSSRTVWTFGDADSEDKDRVHLYIVAFAGLVAGDRQSYTIQAIQAIDAGYSRR